MGTITGPQDTARADLPNGAQTVSRGNSGHSKDWQKQRSERKTRLDAGSRYASGKVAPPESARALLEAVIRPGDRVCLEGDNQKQADFLAEVLASVDRRKIHDLHVVQSGIVLQAHLDLFERGIARKLDFSYSGPQGAALARALAGGKIELGAIHTYIELFARYFMDLTPHVALIAANQADRDGNLYTGPNTEDTPTVTIQLNGVCLTFRAESASGEATSGRAGVRCLRDRTSRA